MNECSFCGKREDEVARLVIGPAVYICNECVSLCSDICHGCVEDKELIKGLEDAGYDPVRVKAWWRARD